MQDENFQRTVVLLVEHGSSGSLGFVLNRKLDATLPDIIEEVQGFPLPIYLGGPVEPNTLHFIHTLDQLPGSRKVYDGLYWGGDFDALQELIRQGRVSEQEIIFFVGYSGWAPRQLQQELDRKAWIIAPENLDYVFIDDPGDLWRRLLQSLGHKYKIISNYPVDPRLN
ncbi:MAG: YqgE/AlgH family protein [Bacteroidia bacterium]